MKKSVLLIWLCLLANASAAQIAWTEITIQSSIDGAYALFAADINGDGKLDLVGNANQDTDLYWWSNTAGDGSSWTRTTITSSGTWQGLEAADIDGDGDMDVVGADASTEDVAWFINSSGDGSAWTEVTIDGSFTDAFEVAVGDVDGDGDLDVVGAANGANLISWWENDGTPSGSSWTENAIKSSIDGFEVAVADIDGDGDLDVIGVDNDPGDAIYWFANNGSGGGWSQTTVDASINSPRAVNPGDLDGDGDIDLVAAADHGDLIAWYENTAGDGSSWTERSIDSAADNARYAAMADIDGDGDLDVIGTAPSDEEFNWYENTAGDGTSWTTHNIDTDAAADSPVYAIAADVDGDGDLDVIGSAAGGGDFISWWENSQRGRESSVGAETTIDASYDGAWEVELGDIDGDGDLDAVATARIDDDLTWWANNGSGDGWTETTIDSNTNDARGMRLGDIDGDGDLDVVAAGGESNTVSWWENDGTPSGANWNETVIQAADGTFDVATRIELGDIDGDGDLDVVGVANTDDVVAWWANDGSPSGADWSRTSIDSAFDGAISVNVADVDGDGDLDVLGAAQVGDDVVWWENTAGTGASWTERSIDTSIDNPRGSFAVDMDGDGDLDVLTGSNADNDLFWYENTNGSGTSWTQRTIDSDFTGPYDAIALDFDGDGDQDVLAPGQNGDEVSWFENSNGSGTSWTEHAIDASFSEPLDVAAGDLDGDGDIDFVAAATGGDLISWWANDTIIRNQALFVSGTASTGNDVGWRLFASPCAGQTRADMEGISISGDDEIRRYDESAGSGDARWLNTASGDALTQGHGFAAYLYDDATQAVGATFPVMFPDCSPTTADISVTGLDVDEEWFLAGNGFLQSFDLSSLTAAGFQSTVKIWNPDASSYTDVTISGGTDDVIPVGQGFFLQRSTVGAGATTLTFDDAGKTSGGTFVGKFGDKRPELVITLTLARDDGAELARDHGRVIFAEDATYAWDHYESSELRPLSDRWMSLALIGDRVGVAEALSLMGLPWPLQREVTIPLQITSAGLSGTATISWPDLSGLPEDWGLELRDLDTGFSQDLRRVADYRFVLPATEGKAKPLENLAVKASSPVRFELVITPAVATSQENAGLPADYALSQNYPNPFNPGTTIRFGLPDASEVTLTVYDLLGREVTRVAHGMFDPGWHEVRFDAPHLVSGVYFYRLATPIKAITKTLQLVR